MPYAAAGEQEGFGLVAFYKDGPEFEAVAFDSNGDERRDWARLFTERPLKTRRVRAESWTRQPEWTRLIRTLAGKLPDDRRPVAVAAVRIEPPS